MCLEGGYKTQTVTQLSNLISAYNKGKISARALRIYFAALLIVAAREAAKRSTPVFRHRKQKLVVPRYLFKELSRLTDCPQARVRGELRSLEAAGLLLFSETDIAFNDSPHPGTEDLLLSFSGKRSASRPIPIPRPVLRFLAKNRKIALTKTCLAYILRGLTLSRAGEVTGKGTAKACWVAEIMGISIRAVRTARAELIALNFIGQDQGSKQWKLNRDGAYFSINLDWQPPEKVLSANPVISGDSSSAHLPNVNSAARNYSNLGALSSTSARNQSFQQPGSSEPERMSSPSAPLDPKICTQSAPPYKNMKTPNGSKNQKTRTSGREQADNSGICSGFVKKPTLHDIQLEDLRRLSRLKLLYAEAVAKNWIEGSEANLLKFVSAAVRATRVGREPVRLFVKLVRNQLWHHITQEQEDRARAVLARAPRTTAPPAISALLSEVVQLKSVTLAKCAKGSGVFAH